MSVAKHGFLPIGKGMRHTRVQMMNSGWYVSYKLMVCFDSLKPASLSDLRHP